jgi:hypothetical protein
VGPAPRPATRSRGQLDDLGLGQAVPNRQARDGRHQVEPVDLLKVHEVHAQAAERGVEMC